MSQVLLGFRNLSYRLAAFLALAALLVWFLGGNLLARPGVIDIAVAKAGSPETKQIEVTLRQIVQSRSKSASDPSHFQVEVRVAGGAAQPCPTQDLLREAIGLVTVQGAATGAEVWLAGRPDGGGTSWRIYRIDTDSLCPTMMLEVADRLEAERQLARLAGGLTLQTAQQSAASRDAVLRAGNGS